MHTQIFDHMKKRKAVFALGLTVIIIQCLLLFYEYGKPGCADAQSCVPYAGPAITEGTVGRTSAGDSYLGPFDAGGNRRRLCYLLRVNINDVDDGAEWAGCEVRIAGSDWYLSSYMSDDADAHCSAYCLVF